MVKIGECKDCDNNKNGSCILDWSCCFTPKKTENKKNVQYIKCDLCDVTAPFSEFNYTLKQLHEWRIKLSKTIPKLNNFKNFWFCSECQKRFKKEIRKLKRRGGK